MDQVVCLPDPLHLTIVRRPGSHHFEAIREAIDGRCRGNGPVGWSRRQTEDLLAVFESDDAEEKGVMRELHDRFLRNVEHGHFSLHTRSVKSGPRRDAPRAANVATSLATAPC